MTENSSAETADNSLLILKSQNGALQSAESFLKNRHWDIKSTTNLREAIAFILQRQPAYVMITSDHANKKVNLLPKMLASAVSSQIIGFSEKGSSQSTQILSQMNLEYNLYPPVSGPAIERMILKIRRDALNAGSSKSHNIKKSGGSQTNDGLLTFKSDPLGSEQKTINLAGAREALRSLISGEDSENSESSVSHSSQSSDPFHPAYRPQHGKNSGHAGGDFNPVGVSDQEDANTETGVSPTERSTPERTPHFRNRREAVHYEGKKADKETPYQMTTEAERVFPEKAHSILVRGTETALNESVRKIGAGTTAPTSISEKSDMACITIESPRFSGYLICAFGKQRSIDSNLMNLIKSKLFGFLKANGEDLKDKKLMNVQLQEVEFTSWALAQADFLKKSIHEGDEIAIAFFPKNISDIEFSDSASKKMVQVGIHDFKEDARVEFDLYVYMPTNNKFLLYTPKGRIFYKNQKGRLSESGIKHLHLKRDEAHELNKYQAQNFLNEKIAQFRK